MSITVADAAIAAVNGPDLENVKIYDHYFHVKQASTNAFGQSADIEGQISRIRDQSYDDQVYYSISIRDASIEKVEKKVSGGGYGPLLEAVATPLLRVKGTNISKEEVHQIQEELDRLVFGADNWLFIVDRIVAGIALEVQQAARAGFPPKTTYLITVKTGSDEDGGTSASVYVILYGRRLDEAGRLVDVDSGKRFLASKFQLLDDFESGRYEPLSLNLDDIGELQSIVIGHDNSGNKPGWLLENVRVKKEDSGQEWTFIWNNWLASDALIPGGAILTDRGIETPRLTPATGKTTYLVSVQTGSLDSAGTGASVWITLGNETAETGRYILADDKRDNFERGQTDEFSIEGEEVGDVTWVMLGHDGSGEKPGWFLQSVAIEREDIGRKWIFEGGLWLARGQPGSVQDGNGRRTQQIPVTQVQQNEMRRERTRV
jgi:hypothetical protein